MGTIAARMALASGLLAMMTLDSGTPTRDLKPPAAIAAGVLAPLPAAEIRHLLDFLSSSGCALYRSGVWYNADQTRIHLEKTYHYRR